MDIEAARVNADGEGFAVVANEVENLAGEAMTAVDDIKQTLQTVRERAEETSK